MSKGQKPAGQTVDLTQNCKSSFTITFAVEILGIDVWHDCNEGWLDLGPCADGIKLQYQLYPGQNYEVDILIWPHVCKIWCGSECTWVRSWQYLQRRWMSFSIKHLFPVRVLDLQSFIATVNPIHGLGSLGSNAKNDKNSEVYLPPLQFGELRYFAPVTEVDETTESFVYKLVWKIVTSFIPASIEDGLYDIPHSVEDVRHQDAVIETVQDLILNKPVPKEEVPELEIQKSKSKMEKDKKKVEAPKTKFEIKLLGDEILAGTGRIVKFETVGDRPVDLGEVVTLISSFNLPAQDDLPILFVNIENLFDVPIDHLKKLKISQIYTRWIIDDETHDSVPQTIKSKTDIKFNDHHALALQQTSASEVTAKFLDCPFEIQLRGIRSTILLANEKPIFFGYLKNDRHFGSQSPPKQKQNEDTDILIAVTKINGRTIAKGANEFIRGEYPLYPPSTSIAVLERQKICTNDINDIGRSTTPDLVVPPYVILEAQMRLEASLGLVGCRLIRLTSSYSRLYALIKNRESILQITKSVFDINREILEEGNRSDLLTGFAIDTCDIVLLYIEGPRDGVILKVWELTADYYPDVKPIFSSSARFDKRIYEHTNPSTSGSAFLTLRMYIPLGVVLACPPIYARPALPIPARTALLKIGRLVAGKFSTIPCGCDLPTEAELTSFSLELCVVLRSLVAGKGDESSTDSKLKRVCSK